MLILSFIATCILAALGLAGLIGIGAREGSAIVLGLICAAILPAAILAAQSQSTGFRLWDFAGWFVFIYPFSLLFATMLGLPAFFLLRPLRPGHWWSVAAAGMLLGAAVALLIGSGADLSLRGLASQMALGGSAALTFWWVWRRRFWLMSLGRCPLRI
jgi:hypothetical protein